jgi:hypothetical protein
MVNSPKLLFNITRSKPEVGRKNNYIWSYKNRLGRFINFTKRFLIKDFFSNFVQFLVQILEILVPTTYPKLSSRSVVDFTESQI